jgi:uncharacterized glyoxalase superfamily protein PhnB
MEGVMSNQARPPKMPWLMPYLTVKDAEKALDFYQRAFGFVKRFAMPGPDGKIRHAEVEHNDAVIMFGPESPEAGCPAKAPATLGIASPVGLYVYCDDVDAQCERARSAGTKVTMPPQDMFWGDRVCTLVDPDGHTWNFATHTGKTTAPPDVPVATGA